MDKQLTTATESSTNPVASARAESFPENMSFKAMLERFYMMNANSVTETESSIQAQHFVKWSN